MNTTKEDDEGTTILKIEARDDDLYDVRFERINKGARNWREITDAFEWALRELQKFGHSAGDRWFKPQSYFGRGAIVRLPRRSLVLVIGLWLENGAVFMARERGAVKVQTLGDVPPRLLKLGPEYLAIQRERNSRRDPEWVEATE